MRASVREAAEMAGLQDLHGITDRAALGCWLRNAEGLEEKLERSAWAPYRAERTLIENGGDELVPSVTTFLLCAVALSRRVETSAATPQLVNLPKLKPLGAQAQTWRVVAGGGLGAVDEPEHRSKHGSARRG